MIIDCHTHMPSRAPGEGLESSAQRFLAGCDEFGIDQAWVFTTDGLSDPDPRHNDEVREFCEVAPERLVPFCSVHPQLTYAVDELHRCVEENDARGVKLHPWLQGFSPISGFMEPVGAALAQLRLPVVFHDGTPPSSSPLQIALFAERHPQVPVILGHGGLHDMWAEALAALQRVPNLYVIPSGTPLDGIRPIVDGAGASRVLFGSDVGYDASFWPAFQIEKIRALGLNETDEQAVFAGNAIRLISSRSLK